MYNEETSNRLTNTILVTQSFATATFISIFTLLSIVAVRLSGFESLAGVPATTQSFAQALAAIPIGVIMVRFGRRNGLSLAYAMLIAAGLVGITAIRFEAFWILLFSTALMGMARAGADQGRFVAAELYPEHLRARKMGRIVFAGTVGSIGGPLLVAPSTRLAAFVGLPRDAGPWLLGMLLAATALVITQVFLRPEPLTVAFKEKIKVEEKPKVDNAERRSTIDLFRIPTVQLAVLAMVFSQTVMVMLMVITPVHMAHHNLGEGAVSVVIAAHTFGMFGLSAFTGRLIDRYGRERMIFYGGGVLIFAVLISPLTHTMVTLVSGLFLLGLGWNFCYLAGSSLLGDALQGEERGRAQGTNDMLLAFCSALGSLSSGPVFGVGDYVGVAGLCFVLVLVMLGLVRLVQSRQVDLIPAWSGGD